MARTVIPTNFKDDELAEEMQGRRRYRQILNLDGTVSFEDETDYDTEGSTFGASRVNEMAQNINESADVNKIIDDLEDIAVVTQNGFMAGAKAVKELNSNLTGKLPTDIEGFSVVDGSAYITYKVGADSVTKKLGNTPMKATFDFRQNTFGHGILTYDVTDFDNAMFDFSWKGSSYTIYGDSTILLSHTFNGWGDPITSGIVSETIDISNYSTLKIVPAPGGDNVNFYYITGSVTLS